ncbi:MAG: LPS export ABC transporter periplasmic protein LptC [Succinatimonas hippei]|nr:LPS export ABC transporter periplasmic protein LptC [Succinatimonas hippei]
MNSSLKNAFFTLLFSAFALLLYLYSDLLTVKKKPSGMDTVVYTSTGFYGTMYAPDGKRYRSLKADMATFSEKDKIYAFKNPVVYSYRKKSNGLNDNWMISSKEGKARDGDFVEMWGDVNAVPESADSQVRKFSTNSLHYNLKNELLSTNDKITIYGKGWIDSGTGFTYDRNTNTMRLNNDVHTTYFNDDSRN